MKKFNRLIQQIGLQDLEIKGAQFIQPNNQTTPILQKLVRMVINEAADRVWSNLGAVAMSRIASNHNPLFMEAGYEVNRSFTFRFFLSGYQFQDLEQRMEQWQSNSQVSC